MLGVSLNIVLAVEGLQDLRTRFKKLVHTTKHIPKDHWEGLSTFYVFLVYKTSAIENASLQVVVENQLSLEVKSTTMHSTACFHLEVFAKKLLASKLYVKLF